MSMEYEMIVGLEVHAELSTQSKIFCSCKKQVRIRSQQSVLPNLFWYARYITDLNEKVVEYAVKMGHALNCKINRVCKQDRKNYFIRIFQRRTRFLSLIFLFVKTVIWMLW